MNKFRTTKECCRDTSSPSNCQNRLLKTTRREKPIAGGGRGGHTKYKKVHCDICHTKNLKKRYIVTFATQKISASTASGKPASISLNFDYPYYDMLFFRTYSEMIPRKHSESFFLPTCNEFQIQLSGPLHLNHGTILTFRRLKSTIVDVPHRLLTYLLHGAESFLRS